jgi:Holliday junction resolvase-like predicted endonuclease
MNSRAGDLSELKACVWLLEQGYEVFRNVSCVGPADLTVFKDGELIMIDVKSSNYNPKSGKYSFQKPKVEGVMLLHCLREHGEFMWDHEVPADGLYRPL